MLEKQVSLERVGLEENGKPNRRREGNQELIVDGVETIITSSLTGCLRTRGHSSEGKKEEIALAVKSCWRFKRSR